MYLVVSPISRLLSSSGPRRVVSVVICITVRPVNAFMLHLHNEAYVHSFQALKMAGPEGWHITPK